eukprot:COSAG04_NODE_6808_length_1251_cov_3.224826_2_plen_96_part_00
MDELREPRLRECCALGLVASSSAPPTVGGIGASRYIPAISSGGSYLLHHLDLWKRDRIKRDVWRCCYGSCGPAKDTQAANGGALASLCSESQPAA